MIVRSAFVFFVLVCFTDSSMAKGLNIYILTGQSNSLGTTELEGEDFSPGSHPADAHTAFYWSNVAPSSSDPNNIVLYGDSDRKIARLKMQQGDKLNPNFWGPEFGMARGLFEAGQRNLMIIKVSRGGGGNGHWQSTGHMAKHLCEQIDLALTAVQSAGNTFEVKGFMYLQGESNNEVEAASAGTRLQELIKNIQAHINRQFTGAADNMYSVVGQIAASNSSTSRKTTTSVQRALAENNSTIGFFETIDLPLKSDALHFGKKSKLEIGRRYAKAFISQE